MQCQGGGVSIPEETILNVIGQEDQCVILHPYKESFMVVG